MALSVIVNFFHLLATAVWIGGMVIMDFVVLPLHTVVDPSQRGKLLGAIAGRFSKFAWASVVVLLVTGFIKVPSGGMFDLSSLHGVTLAVKHGIFLVMIVVGLFISLGIAPKLKSLAPAPGEKPSDQLLAVQRRLGTLSGINLVLGMLVLACVAVMRS